MTVRQIIKKYFYFVLKKKSYYFTAIFLLIVGAVLAKSIPIFYGMIVDSIGDNLFDKAIQIVFVMFIFKLVGDGIKILGDHYIDIVMFRVFEDARKEYLFALQAMDYNYHSNKSSGSLISLAKRGENAVFNAIIQINNFVLLIVIEFLVAIISISIIDIRLGLYVLLILVLNIISGAILIRHNVKERKLTNKADDKITAVTVDNLVGFETIKIFANEEFEKERINRVYVPWRRAFARYVLTFRWLDLSISFFSAMSLFVLFIASINLVQNGDISTGAAVTALVFVFSITRGYSDIIFNVRDLAKNFTDLQKFFDTMELKSSIKETKKPLIIEKPKGKISLENVNFSYLKSSDVLKNINLDIKDGETVALVGESGSGKTTLTRLLIRFFDPIKGKIKIDGVDISKLKISDLRKMIGVIPQDPVLFNESIGYNIKYAKPESDLDKIIEASKKARLHDFIEELELRYDTLVGERGIKLSGGQRQRLAIARVMLENPPIIIFDEATSQLDSKTEREVQAAFNEVSKDKTTIIIAHRLSTIVNADRIFVFDKGEIVDIGTHKKLIKSSKIYKHLWDIQTKGYTL